jgi:hypothetical protein
VNGRAETAVRWTITAGLGLIGAAAGFTHTHDWAVRSGQDGWLAWADAVVIECMALVAGLELHRNPRKPTFPVCVMVGSFLLQMVSQVALAQPTLPGWILAATPALGFLITAKLALRSVGDTISSTPAAPVEGSTPAHATRMDPPVEPVREIAPPVEQVAAASTTPAWPPQ